MSYRQALLFRWSRRDWLAVCIVAVTVTFLTGVVLLVVAMGAQTAAMAGDLNSTGAVTYHDKALVASDVPANAVAIPVARADGPAETTVYVAGVPDDVRGQTFGNRQLAPGQGTTLGTITSDRTDELVGTDRAAEIQVTPREMGVLPPTWYVTEPGTVAQLGQTGTLVIGPQGQVPLRGILAFFQQGTDEVLDTVIASSVGAGVLLVVTVFSVTRMTVRNRHSAIQVARATGATPRSVALLFVGRATLLTAVGVALGGALGVIVTNAAVNAAVAAGIPATLTINPGATVGTLAPLFAGLVVVGASAGALAVRPVVRCPPAAIGRSRQRQSASKIAARLLAPRTVIPAAATLAVFVAFATLIAGLGVAVAPLASTGETTITQPGSPHFAASNVPAAHADALQEQGINASGEIMLFTIADGQPVIARGAEFDAFASVSDAQLIDGRQPAEPDEVVVGRGAARTLDVKVGDSILLGGSTEAGFARVSIVGVYDAPGAITDQVIMPLSTARHLDGMGTDRVQFIRTRGLDPETASEDIEEGGVVDLETSTSVTPDEPVEVVLTVRNDALTERTIETRVTYRDQAETVRLTVPGESEAQTQVTFDAGAPGVGTVAAGEIERSVTVRDPAALSIRGLPEEAPPESELLVRLVNGSGEPLAGATVAVDGEPIEADGDPRKTDADGTVRVPLDSVGQRTVTLEYDNRTVNGTVKVVTGASRTLGLEMRVVPSSPTPTTRPTVEVSVSNPWAESITRTYAIDAPGGPYERTVTVASGRETTLSIGLPRRSSGNYEVQITESNGTVAETTYQVRGDDRIASALATAGYTRQTPLSQAAEVAFGNLRLLLGAIGVLAGLMTIGGTTAAFASAVQARKQSIGIRRAVGASPWQVLRLVLGDATRLGVVAMAAALVAGIAALAGLAAAGYLTAFGVRLPVVPSARLLVGTVVGMGLVILLSATLATAALLVQPPSRLFKDRQGGHDDD